MAARRRRGRIVGPAPLQVNCGPREFRERNAVFAQFSRFVLVGAVATAIQYAVLVALVHWPAMPPLPASTIGFTLSAVTNYLANHRFTFHSDVPHASGLARFGVVAASGLALNAGAMAVSMSILQLHYLLAQAIATAVVLGWNFTLHRRWTYAGARR